MRTPADAQRMALAEIQKGRSKALDIQGEAGLDYRETDRALQALRKAGKIKYVSKKGWSTV